ncbi:MAG: AraC family transcriptional regulator [Alistipes sp.]|nr:AraC family transcriptional regulator [Alistipes sp.]
MIQYYDWLPHLEASKRVDSIKNELVIFTYADVLPEIQKEYGVYAEMMSAPHKFDFFLVGFHLSGSATIKVDMVEYELRADSQHIIKLAPGQIVSIDKVSDDFNAHVVLMSKRFIESLLVYINGSIPLRIDKNMTSVVECDEAHAEQIINIFIKAVRQVLSNTDNPYRMQVVQHIMMAIFYSSERVREHDKSDKARSSADVLSKQFLELVKDNFRCERQLQFYSDKLCITPRYLSRVVKECTGSSAAEWVERYVILEARALLKSTTMTIQQISDELAFPSQTFFGKYFKRRVGMSPKEYRRVG